MRRPLQEFSPAESANSQRLYQALEGMMLPSLLDRWRLRLSMMFQSLVLGPANVVMRHSHESCVHFTGKENLFFRLGLEPLADRLNSNRVVYIPDNPAEGEPQPAGRHFPQLAAVWEYEEKGLKRLQTLQLEIGSGHHLVSLKVCPADLGGSGDILQLDELSVMRGHDYYEVSLEDPNHQPAIGGVLAKVQLMVDQFAAGQNKIDDLLADVVESVARMQASQVANDANSDFDSSFEP